MSLPKVQDNYLATVVGNFSAAATIITVNTPPAITVGYLTVFDFNGNQIEKLKYTGVSGNNLTGCIRGLSFTTNSDTPPGGLAVAIQNGYSMKMSDSLSYYNPIVDILNGDSYVPNNLKFLAGNYPVIDTPATLPTLDAQFATKKYVDGVAIAGGANASSAVKGITKLSVDPVSPTSPIAVGQNDPILTTNSGSALNGTSNKIEDTGDTSATAADGKLVRYPTGSILVQSTTAPTLAGQVISLNSSAKLPAVDGSALTNLSIITKSGVFSKDTSESSGTTTTITHGLGKVPSFFRLVGYTGNGTSFVGVSTGSYNGSSYNTTFAFYSVQGNSTSVIAYLGNGGNNVVWMTGAITTFNSTQVVITWTKNGSMAGMASCYWEAQ